MAITASIPCEDGCQLNFGVPGMTLEQKPTSLLSENKKGSIHNNVN